MRLARSSTAVATTVIVATLAAACSSSDGGGGQGADADGTSSGYSTDTISTLLNTDPSGFDPARATAADDYTVDRMLFDSLLRKDADNALVGGLASDWEQVDASSYTFTIRDDATCSDGTAITPSVVAASLTHFADPATKSNFTALAFGYGTPTFTPDDAAGTLAISLDQPWSELLNGVTLAQSGIICPAGLADLDGLQAGTVAGAYSGPYTLTEATPGVRYTLTLRDDYDAWPQFATPLEGVPATTVSYGIASDSSTTANQLQSGDLDIANVPDDNADRFAGMDGYTSTVVDLAGAYILFNNRDGSGGPFAGGPQDLRVAVAQALSRESFNQAVSSGVAPLYNTVASSEFACALQDDSHLYAQDVDAAAKLLDGVTIRLIGTNIMGPGGAGNIYVQEALEAAGATVELRNVDNVTWATAIQKETDTWDLTVMGDINAVGTMAASLSRVVGPTIEEGGRSFGAAQNPEAVEALGEALAAGDQDAKCAAYEKAQISVIEQADAVPLAALINNFIARPGFAVSVFSGYLDPSTMRITE